MEKKLLNFCIRPFGLSNFCSNFEEALLLYGENVTLHQAF